MLSFPFTVDIFLEFAYNWEFLTLVYSYIVVIYVK